MLKISALTKKIDFKMNYRIIKSITLMKLDQIWRIEVSISMIIEELIELRE